MIPDGLQQIGPALDSPEWWQWAMLVYLGGAGLAADCRDLLHRRRDAIDAALEILPNQK